MDCRTRDGERMTAQKYLDTISALDVNVSAYINIPALSTIKRHRNISALLNSDNHSLTPMIYTLPNQGNKCQVTVHVKQKLLPGD